MRVTLEWGGTLHPQSGLTGTHLDVRLKVSAICSQWRKLWGGPYSIPEASMWDGSVDKPDTLRHNSSH